MTILQLPPVKWELTKAKKIESNGDGLGDGYTLTGTIPFSGRDTFNITIPGLTAVKFNELWAIIKDFAGYKTFEWREFTWQDYKTYVFDGEPQVIPQGLDCWELRLVLKEITFIPFDPNFSNVVLMCHFDGSNGSTSFTDSSTNTKTITTFNGASLTTTDPKFGTACANFTSSQYAEISANADFEFGTGLFTIDFWVKTTQGSGLQQVIGQFYPSVSDGEFSIRPFNSGGSGGGIGFTIRTAGSFLDINSGFNINDGSWHFIRIIRDSPTTLKIGVDGVTRLNYTSLSSSQTIGRSGLGLRMSRNEWDSNAYFTGQIDDLRITKGIARDISELPTSAFPDI